ncbi:MAG: hypothetical protein WC246_00365 [Candidatus Paceibacterota bacterium]|jgi:hypothetical protein
MKKFWQWVVGVGVAVMVFFVGAVIHAQGLVPCGNTTSDMCTWEKLIGTNQSLVAKVVTFALFGFAVPIAVAFFIWGGIKMITSGGNQSRFEEGKKVITGVLWGLLIAFGAWIIINTVITILTA